MYSYVQSFGERKKSKFTSACKNWTIKNEKQHMITFDGKSIHGSRASSDEMAGIAKLSSALVSISHPSLLFSFPALLCEFSSVNPRGVLTARKRFPRFSTLGLTSHPVAGKHPSENATACWYLVESISLPTHLNYSNSGWIWYVLFIYLFYSTTLCFSLDSRRGL